ncbi:MAG: DUF1573 domain-containing protein [Planctomycetes bacterium]|nr:DUF1573 domain-containing protein [Planctomycetota bacterium]
MIRALFFTIALLGPLLATPCSARSAQDPQRQTPPGPRSGLHFVEPRHQFGPVVGLRHLYHSFHFRNPSGIPVTIQEVKISCSCTMSGLAVEGAGVALPTTVPAGASGFLRLRASTEGIESLKPVVITVKSDRGEDQLVLILEGVAELRFEPRSVDFGQIPLGGEGLLTMRVESHDGSPLQLLDWGRPKPGAPAPSRAEGQSLEDYELELERHDRREQLGLREKPSELSLEVRAVSLGVLDVDLRYRPTGKPGDRSQLIRLLFDGERALRVGVSARVEGEVFLAPAPEAFFGGFVVGTPQTWEIVLVDRDPRTPAKLTKVSIESAQFAHLSTEVVALPPQGVERRTRIAIRVDEKLPLGKLEGKLVVETDHPSFRKLETHFSAIAHGEKRRGK